MIDNFKEIKIYKIENKDYVLLEDYARKKKDYYKIISFESENNYKKREEIIKLNEEIERLKELLVKIYGLTFDIDSNIMKRKYALANGFNFEIKDMTREFYFEKEDKLKELKGSDKE